VVLLVDAADAPQLFDGGAGTLEPTTIVDLTGPDAELVRAGRGDPAAFGL
jgi:tRNA A37 threonylcarbamoyladenosine synthetase subunit TsaC/SUA5/YrdC